MIVNDGSKQAPERFYHVSKTQLSTARHYGGCKINGATYVYDVDNDELVRFDIVKKDMQLKKQLEEQEKKKWLELEIAFREKKVKLF